MNTSEQRNTEEPVIEQRYTIGEVAKRVGRHVLTLRRLEAAGKIPVPQRDVNDRRAYTEGEVQQILRYINTYAHPSTKAS